MERFKVVALHGIWNIVDTSKPEPKIIEPGKPFKSRDEAQRWCDLFNLVNNNHLSSRKET